jgi:hypothetical protein
VRVAALENFRSSVARLVRLARVLVCDPAVGLDRIRRKVETRAYGLSDGRSAKYDADPRWEEKLHKLLGAAWPCPDRAEFEAVWSTLASSLDAHGLRVGQLHHDANRALARAAWCVTRHARPDQVVETGVARGVTTRFVLEGLERNRQGRLWSIDLPELEGDAVGRIGSAVPESLHGRWTYMHGASRRLLPKVCSRLSRIELFIHDSLHSERNMLFEMRTAWPVLAERGVLIADDIGMNAAFADFVAGVNRGTPLVASKDESDDVFGIIVKTE